MGIKKVAEHATEVSSGDQREQEKRIIRSCFGGKGSSSRANTQTLTLAFELSGSDEEIP